MPRTYIYVGKWGGFLNSFLGTPVTPAAASKPRDFFCSKRKGERFVKCTQHCVFPHILFSDLAPLDDAVDVGRGGVEVPHALMGNLGT